MLVQQYPGSVILDFFFRYQETGPIKPEQYGSVCTEITLEYGWFLTYITGNRDRANVSGKGG